jgi:Dimerisation domain of Zinc Transporter
MAIGLMIMFIWASNAKGYVQQLTGRVAPKDQLAMITWLAMNHSEKITHVDTVRGYYIGLKLLVELDIVMSGELPLREAHDIAESLQFEIEKLDFVERAFVHSGEFSVVVLESLHGVSLDFTLPPFPCLPQITSLSTNQSTEGVKRRESVASGRCSILFFVAIPTLRPDRHDAWCSSRLLHSAWQVLGHCTACYDRGCIRRFFSSALKLDRDGGKNILVLVPSAPY